jgi:hypothetical protein
MPRTAGFLLAFLLVMPAAAAAQRTDIVVLGNGDRITGEVVRLERGRLEFKTDEAGTLYIEWDNINRVEARRTFEVGTSDGRRFLGRLEPAAPRTLSIAGGGAAIVLPVVDVTLIAPVGASFWRKLDGSFDAGFNYTQSSGVAQLNVNSETVFRRPRFEARVDLSLNATAQQADGTRDDRASLDASYLRFRGARWFVGSALRFETNESLGLRLRSQVGVLTGPRLVNSNRAQLAISGGLVVNNEQAVDAESTSNVEGALSFAASYFTYDRPRTELSAALLYYPSLSNLGRQRLQLDSAAKREVWKDLFLALNVYDSFDSRPPNATFDKNDLGVVLSIGWSY